MTCYKKFSDLHHQEAPLILGNVWDVNGAKKFEARGFDAIGTSSAAIAHMLGYEDGEEISFSELKYIAKRIIANISIPLSVDLEGGYGRKASEIVGNIEQLSDLGVVGINIEDSLVNKDRELRSIDDFAGIISEIKSYIQKNNINIFVNVRTDPFLLGMPNPLEEILKRISAFEQAGADGIFTPGITNKDDIKAVTSSTNLPVNVMCMPELPSFQILSNLGVKRISMGNFVQSSMMNDLEKKINKVQVEQSFDSLF